MSEQRANEARRRRWKRRGTAATTVAIVMAMAAPNAAMSHGGAEIEGHNVLSHNVRGIHFPPFVDGIDAFHHFPLDERATLIAQLIIAGGYYPDHFFKVRAGRDADTG